MKLIFVYGPPAVGKLTISKEIAKLTGYKLFHNHLLGDLLESIFEFNSKPFMKLRKQFRMELFEEAAKANINLIYTGVYGGEHGDAAMKKTISKIEKYGGKVCFVRLYCDEKTLLKRVKHSSREKFGKIKSTKTLKEILKKYDVFREFPYKRSLSIDNSKISAKKVAKMIKSHYKL